MRAVLFALVLVACSDSTAPSGPDFLAHNNGTESARFIVIAQAGDTVFDQVLQVGALVCETLGPRGAVVATVQLSADTLTSQPFTTTADYSPSFADQLLVVAGPELRHTVVKRSCT